MKGGVSTSTEPYNNIQYQKTIFNGITRKKASPSIGVNITILKSLIMIVYFDWGASRVTVKGLSAVNKQQFPPKFVSS